MATEPKTEAKTEARQEAKTEARQEVIEGNTEPSHKYKTWMLKVSVHCEQCKRKVKKVLDSIDGVYSTDIDLRLQKATVVGDVDADTLIKRLKKKTRKHAELWPEKAVGDQKEAMKKDKAKNKEKGKEKEEQRDQESSNEAGGDGENEKEIERQGQSRKNARPFY
ncbi:HEAVY METAL-ASSOCIATED ISOPRENYLATED PLANT PROTEIN 33-RELATED [Salix koriyanagi]|uniref:HEAVY METAL-ASSOCIATED ISOPRENYLATED PLANT PROTEIN 33-RELATED n=1 Tax=Salix koriyanagi TaxID=2511006 RepID=A0A9Q1A411_9ROSI|nr:HEAVY METAL-ASSOCIATED ISOPRENYLATED PLANT PROTEIN 33-RELATED [Salix koriyanagi]